MEIMNDLLKRMDEQSALMAKVNGSIERLEHRPVAKPTVVVDGDAIANKVYYSLQSPLQQIQTDSQATLSLTKKLVDSLEASNKRKAFFSIRSVRSLVFLGAYGLLFICMFGYAGASYRVMQQRITNANSHIGKIDSQVNRWISGNSRDSKSFKNQVQYKQFAREF